MPLASCSCGQIFDIPDVPRSFKQPDGRCAECNRESPTMQIPEHIKAAFPNAKPEAAATLARMETKHMMTAAARPKIETGPQPDGRGTSKDGRPEITWAVQPKGKDTKRASPRKGKSKYPFDKMPEPKDGRYASFFYAFTEKAPNHQRLHHALKAAATAYNTASKEKRRYRYGDEPGGVRVWRIK